MGATEFKRNKVSGIIEIWKDGKYIGQVMSLGDNSISVVPIMPNIWYNCCKDVSNTLNDLSA